MESEVFSRQAGIECFADESTYNHFLQSFEQVELKKFVDKIEQAFAAKDWKELKSAVHTLKGSSGYIGAIKCQKLSAEV